MDGSYYVQIFQDHLIANAKREFSRRWRLQQNNDPKHKSRLAQQFLSSEVAEVIDRPSNNLHANSVENLWPIIKRCVEKRKTVSFNELNKFLDEEWINIGAVTS